MFVLLDSSGRSPDAVRDELAAWLNDQGYCPIEELPSWLHSTGESGEAWYSGTSNGASLDVRVLMSETSLESSVHYNFLSEQEDNPASNGCNSPAEAKALIRELEKWW